MIGGRAGRLAKGRSLTLWINCVETTAKTPKGNGRTLTDDMAQRIQAASIEAAMATGWFKSIEELAGREFVELYPESSNPQIAMRSLIALEKYLELAPDREAMLPWRKFAKAARSRLMEGLPINREMARAEDAARLEAAGGDEPLTFKGVPIEWTKPREGEAPDPGVTPPAVGSEGAPQQPSLNANLDTPPAAPAGGEPAAAPAAPAPASFHGGPLHGQERPLQPKSTSCTVVQMGDQAPEIVEESERKIEFNTAVAIAEDANKHADTSKPNTLITAVAVYGRNARGVFECLGKKKLKK